MHYDPHLALDLAEHAQAVYSSPHGFWKWALDHGCDGASIIEKGSSQVGITYSPERITIAARGSSQRGDWCENFLAFPWSWRDVYPEGRVHFGFRKQTRRVLLEVVDTARELRERYPDAAVYIGGHSLGGAVAALLARPLEQAGIRPTAVYTFESPRVGTRAFATWYNGRYGETTFRVVAVRRGKADIVTRIPPSSWGWQHVGRPIMIRDGVCYESEAAWEAARANHPVKPLSQFRIISGAFLSVQAHLCGLLVEELRVLASEVTTARDGVSR